MLPKKLIDRLNGLWKDVSSAAMRVEYRYKDSD